MWDIDGRLERVVTRIGVARASVVDQPSLAAEGTGSLGVRVEFRDGWQDPVMAVTYRYLVEPKMVMCRVEVEQCWQQDGWGQAFVKEPKLVAAVAPAYRLVEVYGSGNELVRRIDVGNLAEPTRQTAQIGAPDREAIAFVGVQQLQRGEAISSRAAAQSARTPVIGFAICRSAGTLEQPTLTA